MSNVNLLYFPGIEGYDGPGAWAKLVGLEKVATDLGLNFIEPPKIIGVKSFFTIDSEEFRLSNWYKQMLEVYEPYLSDPTAKNILVSYSRGTAMALQTALKYPSSGLILVAPFLYHPSLNYDLLSEKFKISEDLPLYKTGIDWVHLTNNVGFIGLMTDTFDIAELKYTGDQIRDSILAANPAIFHDYKITSKDHFLNGLPELAGLLARILEAIKTENQLYKVVIKPTNYFYAAAKLLYNLVSYPLFSALSRKSDSFIGFRSHVISWSLGVSGATFIIKKSGLILAKSFHEKLGSAFSLSIEPYYIK